MDLFEPNRLGNTMADKIDASGDCWEWMAYRDHLGYGRATRPGRGVTVAHRVVYEALVGAIPEGLELDHLCGNRGCVNPDHLEPVTHQENMRRALQSPTCKYGHPLEYQRPDRPHKSCRTCNNAASRRYRARKAGSHE